MVDETNDVAEDTDSEGEEATNSNEETVEVEDTEAIKASLADALKAKAELTARAKKAEQELKDLKAKPQDNKPNDPQLSDELKLIARGLSDEAIEKAKLVAKGKGIPLLEAIKDPDFLIIKANLDEIEKRERAKLGASHGSGESEDDTLIKPDMTREEHMKAFKKVMG